MALKLGDLFPDFSAVTNEGNLTSFHQWMESSWAILFSHPADYTPVCTTELARAAALAPFFRRRNVRMIALSCDSAESHRGWITDILHYATQMRCSHSNTDDGEILSTFPFPIIADEGRQLATSLGMLDPSEVDSAGLPLTARAVFIIDPTKRLRLSILYPATTGRNFDEILRVIDSLQLTQTQRVATPVDWKLGEKCMVLPSVTDTDAAKLFGDGNVTIAAVPSDRSYMRMVQLSEVGSEDV